MRDEWVSEGPEAEMDARLVRALESRPEVLIPEDFAARVAAKVPARREVRLTQRHYGRNMGILGMVVLAVAMLAVAFWRVQRADFAGVIEWVLCVQFLALAVWFSVRGKRVWG